MYFQSVRKLVSHLHAKYWQLWQSACDQSNYMEVFSAALHTSLVPLTHLLQACVTQALVSVTSRLLVFHIKIKFLKFFLCVLVSMWMGYIWTSIKNNDSKMCLWFLFHQSMIFTSEDVCMLFIWSLQTPTCKIWRRAHRLCSSFKSKPDTSFVLHMYFMMFRLVKQFANAVCFRRLPWCCVFIQMLIHWKKWTFVVKKKV